MPPKKQKEPPVEKQTKLFSQEVVEEPSNTANRARSKQFKVGDLPTEAVNHTKMWEYGSGKTPDKLLISSWNVNGIRSVINKKDLPNYLERVKPDILCLNETKIDHAAFTKDPIKLPGYHGYWNFCKCSSGYSGTAVFSKYLALSVT